MHRLVFAAVLLLSIPLAAATHDIKQLAFFAGDWIAADGDDVTEEQWSKPHADSMIGMSRATAKGKTYFYEILVIEQTENGPVMMLRHFRHGMVSRDEKPEDVTLSLVSLEGEKAIFERADKKLRLTYERQSPDVLQAMLEKENADGKWRREVYRYVRQK
jgi:hypothetical protein